MDIKNFGSAPPLGLDQPKGNPCPALPVCELVGNARNGCMTGGGGKNWDHICLAGLILLTARGQGLYTDEMEEELQSRKIGFLQPQDQSQSTKD
ncbi:MAG: hypothetical protein CL942_08665 [Desulfovibrio sp.]|nr:hypothetical protein [Desulfovibrio sp.]